MTEEAHATEPQTQSRRGKVMDWVFSLLSDISFETANRFYTWGWAASFFGAAVTLCGVMFLMWGTRVRDHHFEAQVATLNTEASKARERAGNLEIRAAEIEKGNLDLQREVERERTERLKLEERVAPRRLTGEQATRMTTALSGAQSASIAIVSRLLDSEGNDFADDFEKVFTASRWTVTRIRNWTKPTKGVFVAIAQGTTSPVPITNVEAALIAANVSRTTIPAADFQTMDPWVQPDVLYLLVGAKP